MASIKIVAVRNKYYVRMGTGDFLLRYGFRCPVTQEGILAVMQLAKGDEVKKSSDLDSLGSVKFAAKTQWEVDGEKKDFRYFFGLKLDALFDHAYKTYASDLEKKMSRQNFQKKVMAGKIPGCHVVQELVFGEDVMLAIDEDVFYDSLHPKKDSEKGKKAKEVNTI